MANSVSGALRTWLRNTLHHYRGLSLRQAQILSELNSGSHLKSHRYLDGTKVYQIHSVSGEVVTSVEPADVAYLEARGLIAGNMKFPAAVYLLTKSGAKTASNLTQNVTAPLSARIPSHRLTPDV